MKTYRIEVQRIKRMSQGQGLVEAEVDALVMPQAARGDQAPGSMLSLSEETARVLFLLLKGQLAEIDKRKARSQR
jgi:hypothetical protein